jgi:hypothetical protein
LTTEISNREKALHLSVGAGGTPAEVVERATAYLAFLCAEGVEAPKAPKAKKATSAPVVVAAAEAPAPAISPGNTPPASAGAAQPAVQTAAAATLDDVRAALVARQTRDGTKVNAQAILEKYSPTKVTGGLKKEDYAKVIAECIAA